MGDGDPQAHFPITTCTTCGQHYFVAFLKDFEFTGKAPGGGEATGESWHWEPLDETLGGKRVVLTDLVVGGSDDDNLDDHERTSALHFCRRCGTAHPAKPALCAHCGTGGEAVVLYAVRQKDENPGVLTSCLSCGANGRRIGSRYREPARPVRATNVADVHVLAQDMVQHSERPRLLVFCDNRQDAAFQAGWMKDHSRRFRLRALMAEGMKAGAISVGDLALHLDDLLEKDESLSRALVPEVWQVVRKEGGGGRHEQERRKFLRIQVLREVTVSPRQAIGLEPWGRMRVEYEGLTPGLPWIHSHALTLGIPPEDLRDGVASLLDSLRRQRVLHDPEREIFSKYWMDGDLEVQQGYLPELKSPTGTKLRRGAGEKPELVKQWLAKQGETSALQIAGKWGVPRDHAEPFLESLFAFLVEARLLVPVKLKGSKGNPLPNLSGLYQVDADKLRLSANHGVWRCSSCRRRSSRRTPYLKCTAWRCTGQLDFVKEDPDNYDLQVLDQRYSMLRPEEHTAMVPHDERERLENLFKGDSEAVNTFVCTPTLELGVDIGQLDAILMRNVPPLPANYWQRAGRAGRRHRMAVDLTYCRSVSHDRAYFADPLKLLAGQVDPPAFNLRNEQMVAKHVHATVITRLHQYTRTSSRPERERQEIEETLGRHIPDRISSYLFDEGGDVRLAPFEFAPLQQLLAANLDDLVAYVEVAFRQGWPAADAEAASREALRGHVQGFVEGLQEVVARLTRRLGWAMEQIVRLNRIREHKGALEPEDDMLFRRCDHLVKRLKGTERHKRQEAEGYDDVNTFGVLAAEGFLPGYGLEVGSILGVAEIPFWRTGALEFALPRPPSVALREYVPGNLIYANGNRFVARRFHRDADESRAEVPVFEVSVERQAVKPTSVGAAISTLGSKNLAAMSVCDVDLLHQSHISDDEELRFQLGVSVFGLERNQHNGGSALLWGERPMHLRRGVRFRLVNVGAASAIERFGRFGYPICTVCGQSVSPLSSDAQRAHFDENHAERCGKKVEAVGLYADVVADALSLPACPDQDTAYSVLEALRFAAARVLDMHIEDLQILVIGHVDRDDVDAILWDPMSGGSGLLDQLRGRFGEIVAIAREVVADCPSLCERSCIDCLQTFRNSYYHKHLDRKRALECLEAWGNTLAESHQIPPRLPTAEPKEGGYPVNAAETKLRHLLLAAGFEEGVRGEQVRLDPAIGTTTPDVIYRAAHHDKDEGICVYLDGLSEHIHGNAKTAAKDRILRDWLRGNGREVIEIAVTDLDDVGAMTQHFRKLAGYLAQLELRKSLGEDQGWFDHARVSVAAPERRVLEFVTPRPDERFVTCVPFVPLEAAAGAFGAAQALAGAELQWVRIGARHHPRTGMFVAQVVGHSMEPRIPDGSFCLFSAPVTGTRQGRILLVQLDDEFDPETGQRFTVKVYKSEKSEDADDSWRHVKVTLLPINRDFNPIEIRAEEESRIAVVAELLEVLGSDS